MELLLQNFFSIDDAIPEVIRNLRLTELSADGTAGRKLLDFLRCKDCDRVVCKAPLLVHCNTMKFVCEKCLTIDNFHTLVRIDDTSCMDGIQFPCAYSGAGCKDHFLFDESTKIHDELCVGNPEAEKSKIPENILRNVEFGLDNDDDNDDCDCDFRSNYDDLPGMHYPMF